MDIIIQFISTTVPFSTLCLPALLSICLLLLDALIVPALVGADARCDEQCR